MMVGQRRVWLALEEQKRRRERASASDLPVPAILLSSDGHGHLTWTCNVEAEFGFTIGHSDDGVTWNDSYDSIDGGQLHDNESGDPGYFRVAVLDENGNPILPFSNAVYSDGSRDN